MYMIGVQTYTMSFGTWLKSVSAKATGAEELPTKRQLMQIAESIIIELEYQIHEAEEKERTKDVPKNPKSVDYSWLATSKPKLNYEIPQLQRLELEELGMKVHPDECSTIIGMFRDCLLRDPSIHEMPQLMRTVILHVLQSRSKEETMGSWMMKSLSKLRPASAKVSPDFDQTDIQRDDSLYTMDNFRVDELPV